MPTLKPSAAARSTSRESQRRAWGTRYDSLLNAVEPAPALSSPTVSSASSPISSAKDFVHDAGNNQVRGDTTTDRKAQSERKRDWADDEVPHVLGTPNGSFSGTILQPRDDPTGGLANATAADRSRRESTKLPHNASVFVGSLPTDVDETELSQQLRERLEQFACILNIKIIRDVKGGVCAFVQCEDAAQASCIVTRTQQTPEIFMGRQLRFELARAFRSLWVSYRKPMQFIPSTTDENGDAIDSVVSDENGTRGHWKETELPETMRIWRPRGARYPVVSYQAEARRANIYNQSSTEQSAGTDQFDFGGILFTELKFDEETMKGIVEAFGPLESFKPYVPDSESQLKPGDYPPGHDSPRVDDMDSNVWEVKWEHRDDCITALSTLRWVPHLAVTWASLQQTPTSKTPRQIFSRQGFFHPSSPASPGYAAKMSPALRGRPFLLLDRMPFSRDSPDSPASPTLIRSPVCIGSPNILPLSPSLGRRGNDAVRRSRIVSSRASETGESDDGWMVVRQQNITQTILASVGGQIPSGTSEKTAHLPQIVNTTETIELRSPNWNETDFPPLKSPSVVSPCTSSQEVRVVTLDDTAVSAASDIDRDIVNDLPQVDSPSPTSHSRPLFKHRRSISNPIAVFSPTDIKITPTSQTVDIPPTPELSGTSLAETPTSAMPHTPCYPVFFNAGGPRCHHLEDRRIEVVNDNELGLNDHDGEKLVDPKTIFVGGLEPFGPVPWDENRLRAVFQKYGEIEHVRIVTQSGKKTAFAFVTFCDESASMKAIREEHDRNYDGRLIRVQLRELNPIRGSFRFRGRGIGRIRRHGFGQHGDMLQQRIDLADSYFSSSKAYHTLPTQTQFIRNDKPIFPAFPTMTTIYPQLVASSSQATDSTLCSSNSFDINPEAACGSQDSDTKTAVSVTPPPTVISSSASNANVINMAAPQSMHPTVLGYFPHPWAAAYGAAVPYQIPVPAAVPFPVPHPVPAGEVASVAGQAGHAVPWNTACRPPFPYPFTYLPVVTTEPPHGSSSGPPTTPAKGQPPLHATGFIQGEQGTLIPVYQPDALNEYMNGSSPCVPIQAQSSLSLPLPGAQAQGSVNAGNGSLQTWPGYPTHPQFYAYAMPPPLGNMTSSSPPASAQGMHGHSAQSAQPVPWSTLSQSPSVQLARRPPHTSHVHAVHAATHNKHHGVIHNYQDSNLANSHGGGLHHRESSGTTYNYHNNGNQHRREQHSFRQGRNDYEFAARPHEPGMHADVRPDTQQSNVGAGFMHMNRQGPYPFQ